MKLLTLTLMFGLITIPGALAQTRNEKTVLYPPDPQMRKRFEDGTFSSGFVARNGMIYLLGVEVIPRADETLEETYTRVFNVIARDLGRAGASWDDVVDVSSYHTNLDTQIEPLTAVNRRFMKAPYAPWTVVEVKRLFNPKAITSIKVTAQLPIIINK